MVTPPTVIIITTNYLEFHKLSGSLGHIANNCRIAHKAGSSYFSIITLRALEPGEEVLVAYGSKFTSMVRVAAVLQKVSEEKDRAVKCNTLYSVVYVKLLLKRDVLNTIQS